MWWKLGLLAVVTCLLLFALVAPVTIISVRVDMPAGAPVANAAQLQTTVQSAAWIIEAVLVASVIIIAGLIARHIVRRHRISN
jgi:hypothetical protein